MKPTRYLAGAAAGIALGASMVALVPVAHAGAKEDINGVWMAMPGSFGPDKPSSEPMLTPGAAAARKRLLDAAAKGYVRFVSNMLCQGVGGPAMFQAHAPFEIFSGFGRIKFVFETEWVNQPRTVYLDEKVQPDNIFPSYNGHSIGHWEGNVLVVDTVGFNGRSSHRGNQLGGVPRSENAHLTERFSLSPDGKILTDEITTVDPKVLLKPWTINLKFERQPSATELFEVTCEVDLDAFKSLDLNTLKGADPEIARLLNPDERESDPALKIAPAAHK